MNSVEAFSMGLACCTNLVPEYLSFLGERNPFHNVHKETLYNDLLRLIENQDMLTDLKRKGWTWVNETHSLEAVMDKIYSLYHSMGWIDHA